MRCMDTMGERLAWARKKAGYKSARAAALAHGWKEVTYRSHEGSSDTGTRDYDYETAQRYGRTFKVNPLWLLHGLGTPKRAGVPIVGIAGANHDGTVLYSEGQAGPDEAPMVPGGSENTVAVEVRGDSMRGIAEDGWLIYYNDRRDPPTEDLVGEVCIVGLADGRVLVKKLVAGRKKHHFDLESTGGQPTIYDARVQWAAAVIAIVPRHHAKRLVVRGIA